MGKINSQAFQKQYSNLNQWRKSNLSYKNSKI